MCSPKTGLFILLMERFCSAFPFLCLFVLLFEIFFSNLPGLVYFFVSLFLLCA